MNNWDVIRLQARRMHAEALKLTGGDPSAEALLSAAAELTKIPRQGLPARHKLLYRAEAVLHSNYVWFNMDVEAWQARFNQAHEYGHYWRHGGEDSLCFEADIDAQATEDAIPLGVERVDGYGPHERRELEANVFAREFLLPGDKLRAWYLEGENAESIAAKTGTHVSMVIHQLARVLLGTELPEPEAGTLSDGAAGIDLDDSQRVAARAGEEEAKRCEREPPILVDAGPGTGKTRTLVARIIHLLKDRNIHPSHILALTYSNKAADEMYSRVRATAAQEAGYVWMGTFHKFGLDLIRQYPKKVGISPKPTVIDTVDAQLLLEQNLARLELHHYRSLRYPAGNLRHILGAISRAKDELVTPAKYKEYAEREYAEARNPDARKKVEKSLEVARVYAVYEALLAEKNYLDYGDLLMRAVRLLEEHEDVRKKLQDKYHHILVDEYQDVNTASRLLVNILADDGDGLWVVGDLRQAIYRFRGAAPVNMRLLATEDFPDTQIIPLKTNYRSQRPVVKISTACAARMRAMKDREPEVWEVSRKETNGGVSFRSSYDENAEAEEMAEEIKLLHKLGVEYRDQAILCRRHESLCHFSRVLEQSGIPVLYLGNFFERPEIRDLLSLVSLASESDGRALYRLARFEEYGFSFKDVQTLTAYAYEHKQYFPKVLQQVTEVEGVSEQGRDKLGLLAQHFEGFGFITSPWAVLSQYLFVKSNYLRPLVVDQSVQAQQNKLAIYQFLLLAYQLRDSFADEEGDKKIRFLNHVRRLKLNNEEKQLRQLPEWADDIDAVRMMTLHAAKGLEFKAVHLPTLSDGQFPQRSFGQRCPPPDGMLTEEMMNWHDDEEECLFFVGLSRAQDHLCISRARQYDHKEADPSRLLNLVQEELPRASVNPLARPAKAVRRLEVVAPPNNLREFDERALATYKECPLEYYYKYILGITDKRADSAFAQTYLCIHQVWQSIGKQFPAGRDIDWGYIAAKIEEVWEAHGPRGHAYEPDYRKEAEAIIRQTLEYHSATETRILRPEWTVPLKNGTVVVRPDYIEFADDGSGLTLFVQHLHLGSAPSKPPIDDYYVLYDIAATRAYPEAKRRIQAMYMTTGETLDIHVTYNWRKTSLQNYERAMVGIIQGEFGARPNDKRCPYCHSYFNCPSIEDMCISNLSS